MGLLDLTRGRPYGLAFGAIATIGALLAAAGGLLVLDWLLMSYPGKGNWQTFEQRTPSWLWQVGVTLVCIGSVLVASAALGATDAERRRSTDRPPIMSERL